MAPLLCFPHCYSGFSRDTRLLSGKILSLYPAIEVFPSQIFDVFYDKITRDDALQARVELDHKVVKAYARDMKNGAKFPELILFQEGEGATVRFWLADGWHRLAAYELNQQHKVPVSVHQGTYREAHLYALGANFEHGLRRSSADKQKAVGVCLLDPAWQQWSNEEIARCVHVDAKTVGNWRRKLEKAGTIPKITTRKATRNGTTTTTNTGNIGKKRQPVKADTPSPQNGVKEHGDETQDRPCSDEPLGRNEGIVKDEKIPFDDVENQQNTNGGSEEVSKITQEHTDTSSVPNGAFTERSRREGALAMGDSEELFTHLQEAIAKYKMEHPLLPDVFVQQAISRLWSAWSGFSNFPMMSGLCQCQTARTGRAPLPMCQREFHVPL